MNAITQISIMITVLLTLLAATYFVPRALAKYFAISAMPLHIIFAAFILLMMFTYFAVTHSHNLFAKILFVTLSVCMGIFFYLSTYTLLAELISLAFPIQKAVLGIAVLVLTIITVLFGVLNAASPQITHKELSIGLDKQVKVAHLSDTHLGHFRNYDYLKKLVKKTNEQKPDYIFITGDLIDSAIAIKEENFALFKDFKAPVYFVDGNHDEYAGQEKINALLKKNGVHVLHNEVVDLESFTLVGLDMMRADHEGFDPHANGNKTIQETLNELQLSKDKSIVLLQHTPEGMKYFNEHGIDLVLCGHTHAGQLFPANFVAKMMFSYLRGHYEHNGTQIYVSEGVGTFGPPMRVGTKSEIILFDLK